MYMITVHMNLGLKFLSCINGKCFNFKKNPFRYYGFSIAIDTMKCEIDNVKLWVKVFLLKGWLQAEITVHTL